MAWTRWAGDSSAHITVMAAHAAYKLLRLPFRLVRGLFRHERKLA